MMRIAALAVALAATALADAAESGVASGSRTVIDGGNRQLAAGAALLRAGRYDEGIELTRAGLAAAERAIDRAAGLANLCAAYAAKRDAQRAIEHCTESIALHSANWRAYSNRAFAFVLAGRFADAQRDLEAAAAIAPAAGAPQLETIRAMIERGSQTAQLPLPPVPQLPTIRAPASAT